jgi:hypothetical protein
VDRDSLSRNLAIPLWIASKRHSSHFLPSSHCKFARVEIAKRQLLRLARKRNLATWLRQNNPPGKSPKTLSSPPAKNIPLNMEAKSPAYLACLTRRGALRTSRSARWDAVDASATTDERG